jgi:hypothetical protein
LCYLHWPQVLEQNDRTQICGAALAICVAGFNRLVRWQIATVSSPFFSPIHEVLMAFRPPRHFVTQLIFPIEKPAGFVSTIV